MYKVLALRYVDLSACLSVCLSACLSARLLVCLPVCLSICLSDYLFKELIGLVTILPTSLWQGRGGITQL